MVTAAGLPCAGSSNRTVIMVAGWLAESRNDGQLRAPSGRPNRSRSAAREGADGDPVTV